MRIIVPLIVWRRPRITELCYRALRALKTEHHVTVLSILSPTDPEANENVSLAEKWCDAYELVPNSPLGRKSNRRAAFAAEFEWDYMLLIGSDDIVSPNFLDAYAPHLGRLEAWGWTDCYFWNKGILYYWPGYEKRRESSGVGRVLNRRLVDDMDWHLWDDDIISGLDGNLTRRLKKRQHRIPHGKMPDDTYLVDVKSEVNITPFEAIVEPMDVMDKPSWLVELGL